MNDLMKKAFDCEGNTMLEVVREIVYNTKIVYDCLVYDKAGIIEETNINFDRIMMMCGDKTGYEASCNEIRIDKLSKKQISSFLIEFDREITKKFNRKVALQG
ncbi:MAG: hypothetical protein K5662_06675 [Lachnospiraceae bacterium]|nr:hypothetical protein [Lachnospiraceae bacterium]